MLPGYNRTFWAHAAKSVNRHTDMPKINMGVGDAEVLRPQPSMLPKGTRTVHVQPKTRQTVHQDSNQEQGLKSGGYLDGYLYGGY